MLIDYGSLFLVGRETLVPGIVALDNTNDVVDLSPQIIRIVAALIGIDWPSRVAGDVAMKLFVSSFVHTHAWIG